MDKAMTLQAAVDAEFRGELMANPSAFDVVVAALPDTIEPPDQEALEFWTRGAATEIYACPDTHHCIGGTYHCQTY